MLSSLGLYGGHHIFCDEEAQITEGNAHPGRVTSDDLYWVCRQLNTSLRKGIIVLLMVVALAALCVLTLHREGSDSKWTPVPRGVSLNFWGYTNIPTKGTVAMFLVTNEGTERFSIYPDAYEVLKGETWVTNSLRNKRLDGWLYWYHGLSNDLVLGSLYDFDGYLDSGGSALFAAPMLVTNAPWRLHFYCVEQATGMQRIADRTGDLVQNTVGVLTNSPAGGRMTFGGKRYYLISPILSE